MRRILSGFILSILFLNISLSGFTQTKFDWIFVEGGSFVMGCDQTDKDCYPDEMPKHSVNLNSFFISKYEITVKQYKEYCKAKNKELPQEPIWGWIDSHPIVNITWQEARDFATWAGGRLPTEAEWEYAARGGKLSQNYEYSGSNNYDEVGWSYENSGIKTNPVGQKKPNELGIYDMSGNVWEWVNDNYEIFYYKDSPVDNPQGPKKGIGKGNRGGCYNFDYKLMRVSHRRGSAQDASGYCTGFRIVKDL